MPGDQPNILVIQADQLATAAIGAYANPAAKTPHIDSLADSGAVFDNAYTNFPLCAPSRFSMMSGQLASDIGAFDNGAEFPASMPTFAHYLRQLGYQTCLVGKMHFVGPDQLHGFEQRLTTDIYPADFGWTGDWTETRQKFGNEPVTFTDAGICKRNVQMEYDDEVGHRTRRKLYDLARGNDRRPFLLCASFTHPHDPYQCREEHWNRFDDDSVGLPAVDTAQADMDPYSRRLVAQYGLDGNPPTARQVRVARRAYFGSVAWLDDLVGSILAVLEDTGLAQNTVILLTTDHGEMLGEHGLWYKKCFFEEACRIPLIVSYPGITPRRIGANVSLVDLLPTLLDIAGDERGQCLVEAIAGSSLWPQIGGSADPDERPVYVENLAEGATTPLLMIKRGTLKYIYSAVDPDQLFDLDGDPHETRNLAGEPGYAALERELRQQVLDRWDIDSLAREILLSQRRRLFLRDVLGSGRVENWDFRSADELEAHCLRGDRVYSRWAYDGVVGHRIPEPAK